MSARRVAGGGYVLTIKLKFDRTSVESLRKQFDEAMEKVVKKRRTVDGAGETTGRRPGGMMADVFGVGFAAKIGAIAGAVSAGVNILMQIASRVMEFSPAFKQLLRLVETTVGLVLKPILDVVAIVLRPVLIALLRFVIIPFYQHVYPLLRRLDEIVSGRAALGIAITTASLLKSISGFLAGLAQKIGPVGLTAFFGVVPPLVKDLEMGLKSVGEAVAGFGDSVRKVLLEGAENLKSFWSVVFEKIAEFGEFLLERWNSFVRWGSQTLGRIGEIIGGVWSEFVTWVSDNFGRISEIVGGAWNNFIAWITENFGKIGEAVGGAWSSFVDWLVGTLGKIGEVVGGAWGRFVDWLTSTFGNVENILGNVWNGFVNWLTSTFGNISGAIGRAWDTFVNWIRDNLGNIDNLLGKAWNDFVNWILRTFGSIWEWFTGLFGGFGRKQFGGVIERPGLYFLEAGERVLPAGRGEATAPSISLNVVVNFSGTVYGMEDIRSLLRRTLEDEIQRVAGRLLYTASGGRVRVHGL